MNNFNFQSPIFADKIQSVVAIDLNSSKTYEMKRKLERKTGKLSVCLFTSTENKIPKKSQRGNNYFLVFRLDFSDLSKNNDPKLDIDLYDTNNKKLKIGRQRIHHISKKLNNNIWTYKVNDFIKINNDIIPINFEFQIKMTIKQTISAKVSIKN